jgi:hypothetical protein
VLALDQPPASTPHVARLVALCSSCSCGRPSDPPLTPLSLDMTRGAVPAAVGALARCSSAVGATCALLWAALTARATHSFTAAAPRHTSPTPPPPSTRPPLSRLGSHGVDPTWLPLQRLHSALAARSAGAAPATVRTVSAVDAAGVGARAFPRVWFACRHRCAGARTRCSRTAHSRRQHSRSTHVLAALARAQPRQAYKACTSACGGARLPQRPARRRVARVAAAEQACMHMLAPI